MTEEQKSFYPDSRAENERLSFAIQAAEIGTWEVDPVDQLMRWDDYTRLLFGATQTGLLPYDQALQYIHPDDHAQVIEAVGWSLNPASNGRLKIDFRIIDSNSQLRWLRCQGKAFFNEQGEAFRLSGTAQNITEIVHLQDQFKSSERLAKLALEGSNTGWFSVRLADDHLDYSPLLAKIMTGEEKSRLNRAFFIEHIHPEDLPIRDAAYEVAAKTGKLQYEARFIWKDGSIHWVRVLGTYDYDTDETPGIFYGTAREVTDEITAQLQLKVRETSLLGAIELAELATWSMDVETGVFTYSQRFMDWLGFSNATKQLDEAFNPLPDEVRQSVAAAIAATLKPGSSGVYRNEHPIINRLTGQVRIIHAQGQVFYNLDGKPRVLSGTARDVTAQRNLQLALEKQVEERTEELKSANEDLATINEELAATNEELAASNEELTESNQLLSRSNENLEKFAYVASHDLQEPLRKIQQFSDLLRIQYGNTSSKEELTYLERIQSAARRMSTLIRDLLSFSRISTRQETIKRVSLDRILSLVLTDLELLIEETGAVIQIGPLPTLSGDPTQLEQLFQNLLHNALKFRQPDVTPQVQVKSDTVEAADLPLKIKPTRSARTYHRIDVADNGIGFDEKYLDRIFQVFQRLHSQREFAGTGIGLAICEKVVLNHGGFITATSQANRGTTFHIYLPAA
ncbi:PAS domain-containing sensor histidine kinase [Spirosoma linguale]|uniref:histidine kinase n=1 Tax=Spirosoma linguale (strain ATCC 33905 / DSM 74 / LMG 10896 / Claus 1) TaxID=504472 RepID=D2QHV8_SPILD|nr:PAS/PAC sensor signal transduction histidine kinase [Spirosoma linguale DSM 74]